MAEPSGEGRTGSAEPALFFLSDYGTTDEFVGVVHAVLHRLAPSVPVIDLTHQIPPYDVAAAAASLVRSGPYLGPGVVLAVVDPGVGTGRRGVALELGPGGPGWLVGPDNGLLGPLAASRGGIRTAVVLDPARLGSSSGSSTFDGRDVFAPAAAHLVGGGDGAAIGTPMDPADLGTGPIDPVATDGTRRLDPATGELLATVSWIDRFGNAQLDVAPPALGAIGLAPGGTALVTVGARASVEGSEDHDPGPQSLAGRWVGAFAQLERGELGLIEDANGRMALVLNRESAAAILQLSGPGVEVRIATRGGTGRA